MLDLEFLQEETLAKLQSLFEKGSKCIKFHELEGYDEHGGIPFFEPLSEFADKQHLPINLAVLHSIDWIQYFTDAMIPRNRFLNTPQQFKFLESISPKAVEFLCALKQIFPLLFPFIVKAGKNIISSFITALQANPSADPLTQNLLRRLERKYVQESAALHMES